MRKLPAIALLAAVLVAVAPALAAEVDALRGKVDRARDEAAALAGEIRATHERFAAAQAEADAAATRERELSGLLASGRERAARLAKDVAASERRLTRQKQRLRRARGALAARLIAIYQGGAPSTASFVLSSSDVDDLAVRTEYLERIEESGAELAERVKEVRDGVRFDLRRVAEAKRRVDSYNERMAAARSEISAVRGEAEAAAAELEAVAAERRAALSTLKEKIEEWVEDIEAAEAASRAAAEETVGRWLGGPYSIPTYIVMCESGGNYSALNPSSGAGGAYQILPSTWDLYGGKGAPHEAPKAEQDRIAAEIWADSGGSAWVCA
ncbi:MAG TPA: transglycosylase family protein [Solirubrobacterales bacterium]